MKKSINNLIKVILFCSITIILINKTGDIFIPESSNKKFQGVTYNIKGYYLMPKNSIDVLFLGDSSLMRTISPMEMWEKEGIASYNYSVTAAKLPNLYYLLKDALKYQKPKVVITDPVTMFYHYDVPEPQQRISGDYMSFGSVKLEMINDKVFKNSFEDKLSYIFPLLRYHSRWGEMSLNEISKLNKDYTSITRGFVMSSSVIPNKKGYKYMRTENKVEFKDHSKEYMIKMINICKENDIDLIILGTEDTRVWGMGQSKAIQELAKENDIKFIDLNTTNHNLNWLEDTMDGGGHLNVLGAMKATSFMTDYLKENYNLKDHRKDKKYEYWNKDYKKYKYELDKYIQKAKSNIKQN